MLGDSGSKIRNIKYVAVARSSDQVTVASYMPEKGDHNSDQYHNAVQEVLSAPDFQYKVTPGSRYRLVGDINAFNFTTDAQQRVYIVITTIDYPERLVFPLINEIIPQFKQELGDKALTCEGNALTKKTEPLFSKLVNEYDDPSKKDKLSAVISKVEDVKLTMHSNIDGMLRNIDHTEQVEKTTAKLHEQAKLFDQQARDIKRQEQWKNMKIMLIIGGIVSIVLIVIIVTLAQGNGKD